MVCLVDARQVATLGQPLARFGARAFRKCRVVVLALVAGGVLERPQNVCRRHCLDESVSTRVRVDNETDIRVATRAFARLVLGLLCRGRLGHGPVALANLRESLAFHAARNVGDASYDVFQKASWQIAGNPGCVK